MRGSARLVALGDLIVFVGLVVLSVALLTEHQQGYLFRSPWTGFPEVALATGAAAIRVWLFWGAATLVLGALLVRIEPRLSTLDALLGGALALWIFAWLAGQVLGPIGLYRPAVVRALLAAGVVWLLVAGPRRSLPRRLETGQRIALLTCALTLPGLLLVQLGSPVPPYMDILATPASAQRIVTFGYYLPFDSDPYGYWGPVSQLPGLELFYALLAMGGGTQYAVLADTAAIVPMGCLFIGTIYRFGKTIGGDLVGGMSTLFLTATMFLRVLPYMHGRTVSFVLVGAGLAFLLDRRRTATHIVLAGLALATAVASHAVYGALGMAVASAAVLGWIINGNFLAGLCGVGVLAGASLVALPTVAIGVQFPVPYPVLPLVQVAGLGIVLVAGRRLATLEVRERGYWLRLLFALAIGGALLWHPPPLMGLNHPGRFPILVYGGGLGLIVMCLLDRPPMRLVAGPLIAATLIGLFIEYGAGKWHPLFEDPEVRMAVLDSFHKMEYWYPYVLVFPAAYLAALAFRPGGRLTMYLLLALLLIPWRDRFDPGFGTKLTADPNYHQHSIVEGWSYQAETGKRGYWGSTRDRRWLQSPAQFAASRVLMEEVEAGRIGPETHVVHVSAYVTLFQDQFLFSLYTGINDDSYLTDHRFSISDAGSRLRPIGQVHERLEERPPYIAIHNEPSVILSPRVMSEYDSIFEDDGIQLLRHRSLAPAV